MESIAVKVLYIGPDIYHPKTGGEYYDSVVCNYLKKQNVDVCTVIVPQIPRFFLRHTILLTLWLIYSYLASRSSIIIESCGSTRYFLFNHLISFFRLGTVIGLLYHFRYRKIADVTLRRKEKEREKRLIKRLDRIVTISRCTLEDIVSMGFDRQKVSIIHPGVNKCAFQREVSNSKDIVDILFVGHCSYEKGLLHLVEAFSLLDRSNLQLHIVGSTDYQPDFFKDLKAFIEKKGMEKDIIIHRRVSDEELSSIYSTADIFVLPSLWEGFGIVYLEAMCAKLPIIATNVSAIPEVVIDGENGILVPPEDSPALAKALETLINSPDLRIRYGERGYEMVQQANTWDDVGRQFYSLLENL